MIGRRWPWRRVYDVGFPLSSTLRHKGRARLPPSFDNPNRGVQFPSMPSNTQQKVIDLVPRIFQACRRLDAIAPTTGRALSPQQAHVLDQLDAEVPTSLQALASRMGVTAPTMSVAITRLVREGYVRRNRDSVDGRRTRSNHLRRRSARPEGDIGARPATRLSPPPRSLPRRPGCRHAGACRARRGCARRPPGQRPSREARTEAGSPGCRPQGRTEARAKGRQGSPPRGTPPPSLARARLAERSLEAASHRLGAMPYFARISLTRSSGIGSTVRPRLVTAVAMVSEL